MSGVPNTGLKQQMYSLKLKVHMAIDCSTQPVTETSVDSQPFTSKPSRKASPARTYQINIIDNLFKQSVLGFRFQKNSCEQNQLGGTD